MKKILLANIVIMILHLIVIQDAYYMKPVSWFLFVWLLDLTLIVMLAMQLFLVIKYEFKAKRDR